MPRNLVALCFSISLLHCLLQCNHQTRRSPMTEFSFLQPCLKTQGNCFWDLHRKTEISSYPKPAARFITGRMDVSFNRMASKSSSQLVLQLISLPSALTLKLRFHEMAFALKDAKYFAIQPLMWAKYLIISEQHSALLAYLQKFITSPIVSSDPKSCHLISTQSLSFLSTVFYIMLLLKDLLLNNWATLILKLIIWPRIFPYVNKVTGSCKNPAQ